MPCLADTTPSHDFRHGNAAGEHRTTIVLVLTIVVMRVEIAAGHLFNSMALLADGWHMGTHAAAFGITVLAYRYARRHARDPRFAFGPGKVGALGGFASAMLLGVVAAYMVWESVLRLLHPAPIAFDQAMLVAIIGLLFNLFGAWLLGHDHEHDGGHAHGHSGHSHGHSSGHHDLNLRAAYLHVLADALTSVFAIAALLGGKYFGWNWLDAIVGIVGAVLISRWALSLVRETSTVLLDREMDNPVAAEIREAVESDGDSRLTDLHLLRVGIGQYAVLATIVSHQNRSADEYRARIAIHEELVHFNLEVARCPCR
ncbi:MAG TPA: CDF family Co(II)/Ni(II) efflux transporter DmeF [Opitutaceae bacterium]|nr:CDF family Co(II)/Ni(II) efflux transporter DmeF [Opitutaceae bacterium]